MDRKSLRTALAGLLLVTVASGTQLAAKSPEKIVLSSESDKAVVVIKADWWQPAPSMKSAFKLTLSRYDPDEQKLLGGVLGGDAVFEAKQKNYADGYLAVVVKPGRYAVQKYSQQDQWALCFNAATLQFDVKPGEVVYLGEFDALRHRQELSRQATQTGKFIMTGYDFADFFDLPNGPRLSPVDESQLATLRTVLARRATKITAPVRAAEFADATFGTGSTLFGERRCGGYFNEGAKD